jgi:catalase
MWHARAIERSAPARGGSPASGTRFRCVPDPSDPIIDAILGNFPGHRTGTRPIHAPGIAATGWFRASAVASSLSDATHLAGGRVPVTVRFSNGTGLSDEPDSQRAVRGMAVRFHLGDGGTSDPEVGAPVVTDMVGMTLPVFFVRSVDDFLELTAAAAPVGDPPPPSWWRRVRAGAERVVGQLKLLPPLPDVTPSERRVLDFANRHPPARLAVAAATLLVAPESYATCVYHCVHAFNLTAGGRTQPARFRWDPVAGVRPAGCNVAGNYLHEELEQRLRRGPAEFVLRAQLGEQGDDTADPTTPWPQSRRRVVMGHLWLDALAPDQEGQAERIQYDPTRLVPGIGVSDDEMLRVRGAVYARSAARRLADRDRRDRRDGTSSGRRQAAPAGS